MDQLAAGAVERLDQVRGLLAVATQRLLGDTISVGDEDWRGPSRLPGWSRGHVATHLARQADALGRLVSWARSGERQEMYASPEQRAAEIEEGSGRSGLELQIDLDTSAGRLGDGFDSLDEHAWHTVVEMRGGFQVPARLLPLGRLFEVVLHHVDLDIGYEVDAIDPQTAEWLLEWCAFRLRDRDDFPRLDLHGDSGWHLELGQAGDPVTLRGRSARLLGRVTGRLGADAVEGGPGLDLPAF